MAVTVHLLIEDHNKIPLHNNNKVSRPKLKKLPYIQNWRHRNRWLPGIDWAFRPTGLTTSYEVPSGQQSSGPTGSTTAGPALLPGLGSVSLTDRRNSSQNI